MRTPPATAVQGYSSLRPHGLNDAFQGEGDLEQEFRV